MATTTNYYGLSKPSYNEVADIEVINANMDKIDTQMKNNSDGVNFAKGISSDAYDNSRPYAVGDYCIYDNKLYRCITAIESAEAFNVEKWEQTTVGNEINQLNSNLDLYADFDEHKTPYTFIGKPIYRKLCKIDKIYCVNVEAESSEAIKYHPIADNIDQVWLKEGFYFNNINGHSQPIPFLSRVDDPNFSSIQLQVSPNGYIVFICTHNSSGTAYTNNSGYFVFYYTKTTDV